ncbi:chitinase-3-like protein 1 [Diabrotica virgifera virgifera]|uniref:chitinase n=1 Tax=Diabrotica virgifera virgifera TaxID=50390 RepID=A0A6P7G3P6_DIAVI|nr:chitinase-3-like protein 1 [Diabrotica virgifera virgifera]
MWVKLVLVLVATQLSSEIVSATTSRVVCYHGTWARYRNGKGAYQLTDIPTSLCTHLIYSFIGLSASGEMVSLDSYLDNDLNNLNKFTGLKSSNSNLKTLVAIGGWNEGSVKFSTLAASASLRSTFIQNALQYCQNHNFDGLDFDWEYPAQRGGAAADKENFITLLKETKAVFEANGLLVSVAVAAGSASVALSYDVARISQYVDMINVMTYDLHGSWDGVLGHNAPLYASSVDTTAASKQLNVDAAISNWIAQGADPQKINLGVPLYGRTFTITSSTNVAVGAVSSGAGISGPYTLEAGYLGYNEIVEKELQGGWTYVWDNEQQVPHMYKGDQWVGFDDPKAVQVKTKYAQDKGLGGVMAWAIETDDFQGLSGVKNPLLRAINEQLATSSNAAAETNESAAAAAESSASAAESSASAAESSASAAESSASAAESSASNTNSEAASNTSNNEAASNSKVQNSVCSKAGYVRDPSDCSKFYYCAANTSGVLVGVQMSCYGGLYFDTNSNVCNWKALVTNCN